MFFVGEEWLLMKMGILGLFSGPLLEDLISHSPDKWLSWGLELLLHMYTTTGGLYCVSQQSIVIIPGSNMAKGVQNVYIGTCIIFFSEFLVLGFLVPSFFSLEGSGHCFRFPSNCPDLECGSWYLVIIPKSHSVQFSCSVMSDSLRPHGLQHTRLPYPSPTPEACSNSCSLSHWCHPTISSCRLLLLPSIFPSIKVFSSESDLRIRWAKVLELQLQHQSFLWIFRTDFL